MYLLGVLKPPKIYRKCMGLISNKVYSMSSDIIPIGMFSLFD